MNKKDLEIIRNNQELQKLRNQAIIFGLIFIIATIILIWRIMTPEGTNAVLESLDFILFLATPAFMFVAFWKLTVLILKIQRTKKGTIDESYFKDFLK